MPWTPQMGASGPSSTADRVRCIERDLTEAEKVISMSVLKIAEIEKISGKLESWKKQISDVGSGVNDPEWNIRISSRLNNVSEHVLALQTSICKTESKDAKLAEDTKCIAIGSFSRTNKRFDLPGVNLLAAISLLSLRDIMMASLVCKQWSNASGHIILHENVLTLYGKKGLLLRLGMFRKKLSLADVRVGIKETLASSLLGRNFWVESLLIEKLPEIIEAGINKREKMLQSRLLTLSSRK